MSKRKEYKDERDVNAKRNFGERVVRAHSRRRWEEHMRNGWRFSFNIDVFFRGEEQEQIECPHALSNRGGRRWEENGRTVTAGVTRGRARREDGF